jgi:hypothetical protein
MAEAQRDCEANTLTISRDNTERLGVNAVEAIFLGFKWTFRPQEVGDYGIDAQVEIWEGEEFTGKLIALQIKSGVSYFRRNKDGNYVFTGELKHLDYWTRHRCQYLLFYTIQLRTSRFGRKLNGGLQR